MSSKYEKFWTSKKTDFIEKNERSVGVLKDLLGKTLLVEGFVITT